MKQMTLASLAYEHKKKVTRREKFLSEMERVVPWSRLISLITPVYPKIGPKGGRPPMPLDSMLRIYFMQQWYNLSDELMEDSLYESEAMRRFAGLELGETAIPDESTILNFRHLLEQHELTKRIFAEVNQFLSEQGLICMKGTLVDATIIAAPSSSKNAQKKRSPEMSSTKKGNTWHFGMKAHIGVDAKNGVVHTLKTTTASTHDSRCMDQLLHGKEELISGDKAYVDENKGDHFKEQGKFWAVMRKAPRGKKLSHSDNKVNRMIASLRAKVEHPFRVLKCQFGYVKTRYRGLKKNTTQLFSLFALANLYLVRNRLLSLQENFA